MASMHGRWPSYGVAENARIGRDLFRSEDDPLAAKPEHHSERGFSEGTGCQSDRYANFAFVEPEREYAPAPFGRHSALAPAAKRETNSKPLDVFFFGSDLFLGDGRFNKPPERQRVKAIRIRC